MTSIVSVPPEMVEQWVDLLESHSDQAVFTLAAHWGYTQAVEELEEFLKKTVDTPCSNSMTTQINGDKLFVIDHHPAVPPSDLLKKWEDKWFDEEEHADVLLIQAFQAGADQELEACCGVLDDLNAGYWSKELRAARRPKPPSLKEQALQALKHAPGPDYPNPITLLNADEHALIRRALEQLDD